ncbi:MAG: hypothetical protein ACI4SG_08410 [Oligosphaeraceae bacterium]
MNHQNASQMERRIPSQESDLSEGLSIGNVICMLSVAFFLLLSHFLSFLLLPLLGITLLYLLAIHRKRAFPLLGKGISTICKSFYAAVCFVASWLRKKTNSLLASHAPPTTSREASMPPSSPPSSPYGKIIQPPKP